MKIAKAMLTISIIIIVLGFPLAFLGIYKMPSSVGAISTIFGVISALLGFFLLGLTMALFARDAVKSLKISEGPFYYNPGLTWMNDIWPFNQKWYPEFVAWLFRIWGLIFAGCAGFLFFHSIRWILKSV
ncbi:MAG: hypothetical protein V1767_06015 [Chloroflexota bacterium]